MRRFVFGALCHRPLLETVLGREPEIVPARLPGTSIFATGGGALDPGALCVTQGAAAEGYLIADPQPDDAARIAYFYGDREIREVSPEIGGSFEAAETELTGCAREDCTGLWNGEEWTAEWAELATGAAREIMAQYGDTPPARMAGLRPFLAARAWAQILARDPAPATLRRDLEVSEAVDITRERGGFEGFFKLRAFELRHRRFDGEMSDVVEREGFVAYDAALVLPYDPVNDLVLLIEQLRYGPILRGDPRPWILEPVAGLVDAGETPESCVMREAEEEAGLRLREVRPMVKVYGSPGYVTEFFHCYLGLVDLSSYSVGIGGLESENEDIRSHVLTFDEAMALVDSGEVNAGPLAMMLLWLARARPALRAGA